MSYGIGTSDKDENKYETFEVEITGLQPASVFVKYADADEEQNLPRSVIYQNSDIEEKIGATGEIMVEKWFAKKLGWL